MSERRYSEDHLWVEPDGSGMVRIGVTRYAQEELGDILFVELPKSGAGLASGQSFGVIESVKTASDLIAPVSGEVVEVNALLREEPWQVNDSPEGAGWILKARLSGPDPSASLMDERAYRKLTEG